MELLRGNSGHAHSFFFLVGKMYLCYICYIIKDVNLRKETIKASLDTNVMDNAVCRLLSWCLHSSQSCGA